MRQTSARRDLQKRQTTDHVLQTTDHALQTTDHALQTTDRGLQTTDHALQTTDRALQTTDHALQTSQTLPRANALGVRTCSGRTPIPTRRAGIRRRIG